jgi:hypothetical protein
MSQQPPDRSTKKSLFAAKEKRVVTQQRNRANHAPRFIKTEN